MVQKRTVIDDLQEAFGIASAETTRTYKILMGSGSKQGLETTYLLTKEAFEKNPNNATFKLRYENAKKLYDTAAADYKRAQDAKNAARLALNRAKGTSEKEKSAKDLVDKYNQAVDKVKEAEALIPSRGQAQYDAAVQAAYDAATAAKAAGGKIDSLPKPAPGVTRPEDKTPTSPDKAINSEEVTNNKFKDYTVDSNGSVYGPGSADASGVRTYFVSIKNPDGSSSMQPYTSVVKAREEFLKNYPGPGGLDKLKQDLLAKNYIKRSELSGYDWLPGLDLMISKYTYEAVSAVKYGGAKEAPLIDVWFATSKGGVKGTTSKGGTFKDSDLNLTTIGDAYTEIDEYMIDAVGRVATQEEKDAYYKDINTRELKSSVETVSVRDSTGKITKSTRTGVFVTPAERLNAKNAIVVNALEGTDAGDLLKSAKGSQVAVQIGLLQNASADYGQPLTAGEALRYVIAGGTEKDAVAKQTEIMRLNAMTVYSNLREHIKDGGTVKSITDQYARLKSLKLGITIPNSLVDQDVIAAVTKEGGLMSTAEFTRQMQANPLWRQTDEARDVAADFANTILKSFGFMG